MGGSGKSSDKTISGINVTPLVDVLLVLLVIFMVTTKVVNTRQVPLELPKVSASADTPLESVELVINSGGEATCAGKNVTLQSFRDCFSRTAIPASTRVIIAADRRTPHGAVVGWLNTLQQADFRNISFATVDP